VWPTPSKPEGHAVLGPAGLGDIVRGARVPVLAIGGVTLERFAAVAPTGAAGAAAIGAFMGADTGPCRAVPLRQFVREARERFDTVRSRP
jgi:thiamine-phosphate pyrophosphorylase